VAVPSAVVTRTATGSLDARSRENVWLDAGAAISQLTSDAGAETSDR
jgi:hypothetical protein